MILITGGAGYIGSHVAKQLLENNYNIIIVDNLSGGKKETIQTLKLIKEFIFIEEDLSNTLKIDEVLKKYKVDTIIHFAASIIVSESVKNPLKYYKNNTVNSFNLIELAVKNNIAKFIFSSTAAVYGESESINLNSIVESSIKSPINPYGHSKLMVEQALIDTALSNDNFKYVIFRYFNVAGADVNFESSILRPRLGECHEPETHLIPLVIKAALKKSKSIKVFGTDYNTPDGTCIRDYIHVDDLSNAHIKAISYLDTNKSDIFNIGYSKGFSVNEVIETVKKVTKLDFNVEHYERRNGDSSILVANSEKLMKKMNWEPKYNNLELICKTAFEWEKRIK